MNIALIAHDTKKDRMVQFCIAYCGVLSKHNLSATGTTGGGGSIDLSGFLTAEEIDDVTSI